MQKSICIVAPHIFPHYTGGAEVQIHYIISELAKRGWAIYYLGEDDYSGSKDGGVVYLRIPERKKNFKFLNSKWLRRHLQKINPDVIYVRPVPQYLFPVWLSSRSLSARTIWACSSDVQLGRDNYLKGNAIIGLLNYFAFKYALSNVSNVILQTSNQADLFSSITDRSYSIIPNGHPFRSLEETERTNTIVWIGRANEIKNPLEFVNLARSCQETDLRFVMVISEMAERYSEALLEAADQLENFQIIRNLDRHGVNSILSKSRILCNTSHAEGFSNTFIEAWMNGVPVLSLNADPEKILSGRKGGYVCRDTSDMKEIILQLTHDPKRWGIESSKVKDFAGSRFRIGHHVDQLEKMVNENGTQLGVAKG